MQSISTLKITRAILPCGKFAPDLPQSTPHRAHQWHTNRPGKLNILDVFSDDLSVLNVQTLKPFPHGLPSGAGAIKSRGQSL